jgi:hypothetical protein
MRFTAPAGCFLNFSAKERKFTNTQAGCANFRISVLHAGEQPKPGSVLIEACLPCMGPAMSTL